MKAVGLRKRVEGTQIWQHSGVSSRRLRPSLALGVLPSLHFLEPGEREPFSRPEEWLQRAGLQVVLLRNRSSLVRGDQ